ncbi:DNA-binding protein [Rhodococcus sp. ZPP]|uniref:DNA-binding protein n=1 Tax=Rhodococcus sp. ZPP TaxID=2749906 RepID=UPI001AD85593|nr:DNA-binding protein [Rhodococcus sp. ZPP]QTJ65856.1 DNA-binding protein [Rhodococcus sp. ZPP]
MATNDESDRWAEQIVKRVGATAKALRGKRSAKWLSERTAELGFPLSPQVIARLDSGKRAGHLEVSELIVLAAALDVSPVELLLPELPDAPVELWPGLETDSTKALLWMSGELAFVPIDHPEHASKWGSLNIGVDSNRLVSLARRRHQLEEDVRTYEAHVVVTRHREKIDPLLPPRSPAEIEQSEAAAKILLESALRELDAVNAQIKRIQEGAR